MPRESYPGTHLRRGLALLSLLVTACVAADAPAAIRYHPDPSLERLQHAAVAVSHIGIIRDFDLAGDTLYLLDRGDVVHVLQRAGSGWRRTAGLGRRGAGPGEFRNASGIAVLASGAIAVAEAGRLQVIRPDGAVESTHRLRLPCAMMLPGMAAAGSGLFIFGNCLRRGHVTDTMKAVLAWTDDREHYRIIAEEISFTTDGSAGSMFSAQRAFTPSADGTHLFGTGIDGCITAITTAPSSAERRCGLVQTRYSAPPPPDLERRIRSGAGRIRISWPAVLPAYLDRLQAGAATVLLRPFGADSLVLQAAEPDGRDLAVAPLNGFVGCRAAGCLWLLEDSEPMRMLLLETVQLMALLRDGEGS